MGWRATCSRGLGIYSIVQGIWILIKGYLNECEDIFFSFQEYIVVQAVVNQACLKPTIPRVRSSNICCGSEQFKDTDFMLKKYFVVLTNLQQVSEKALLSLNLSDGLFQSAYVTLSLTLSSDCLLCLTAYVCILVHQGGFILAF